MQDKKTFAAAALLGVALVSTHAIASAPAGVWVKVQKVVYAPDAKNPTHVQVHGALMLFDGKFDGARPYPGYTSPALGYMYYDCPAGQAEICRQEWSDLEANIAKPATECLGFGMQSLPTGTLRQLGSKAEEPDAYPIQSGVSPGFSPCQAIATFKAEQGGGGGSGSGGGGGGGGDTPSGGTGSSMGGKPADATAGATANADAGTGASGEEPTSGSPTGTGKDGTGTGRRPGSGILEPDKPAEEGAAEGKAAGCSVATATGAASFLGLGAAFGIFGLALARRNRQRK